MLLNKFEKIDFKHNSAFVNLQLSHHLYKLFFLLEAFKNLPLMKRDRDDTLPFCTKNFFVLLYDVSSIFGFLYFISSLVYFIYFNGVLYHYGLFPHSYKQKSKTTFTNKNVTPLSTKRVLLYIIKGCKSTP